MPTVAETVKGFELPSWIGLVAPAGTATDIIKKISVASAKVLNVPEIKKKLASYGLLV